MGKTQKGALWLDENKCSVYDFYQYFRNVEDCKVAECMRLLTFMDLDEIAELTKYTDERINSAKSRLAYEVTKLVHGQEKADEARRQAEAAFSGNADAMPSVTVKADSATPVVDVMVLAGVATSKSEARRLVEGGGVKLNESKVPAVSTTLGDMNVGNEFVLHKGKKVHLKVTVE
jgi:tyrosyl-tRNA synthetase